MLIKFCSVFFIINQKFCILHANYTKWNCKFLHIATAETKEVNAAPKAAPAKKPPAKAPAKPLPQMMEEDVIPSLKAILEAQEDLSDIELVFQDNKVCTEAFSIYATYCFQSLTTLGYVIRSLLEGYNGN